MFKDKRKSLRDMMYALKEAEIKMIKLLDYTTNMETDKETTLFEAVRDLYDDTFAKEIEAEEKADRDCSDYADYKYEMMRDMELEK